MILYMCFNKRDIVWSVLENRRFLVEKGFGLGRRLGRVFLLFLSI